MVIAYVNISMIFETLNNHGILDDNFELYEQIQWNLDDETLSVMHVLIKVKVQHIVE